LSTNREREKSDLSFAARAAIMEGHHEEAIALYKQYIDLDPADVTGVGSVALLKMKIGASDATHACEQWLQCCEQALQTRSADPVAWYQRAWALSMLGQHERVRTTCNNLLESDPNNIVALTWKGKALCSLGREDEGQAILAQVKAHSEEERRRRQVGEL
jgi:tetratricopeptide (TPR) repeat protein